MHRKIYNFYYYLSNKTFRIESAHPLSIQLRPCLKSPSLPAQEGKHSPICVTGIRSNKYCGSVKCIYYLLAGIIALAGPQESETTLGGSVKVRCDS